MAAKLISQKVTPQVKLLVDSWGDSQEEQLLEQFRRLPDRFLIPEGVRGITVLSSLTMSSEPSTSQLRVDYKTPRETAVTPRETRRQLSIPNDRSSVSIVSYVGWVLIELTHENLTAEYRSSHLWGTRRTQYTAENPRGEVFSKHHYDARLGWHTETLVREELRTELVNRLSRSRPETSDPSREVACRCDRFVLKPLHQLP